MNAICARIFFVLGPALAFAAVPFFLGFYPAAAIVYAGFVGLGLSVTSKKGGDQ